MLHVKTGGICDDIFRIVPRSVIFLFREKASSEFIHILTQAVKYKLILLIKYAFFRTIERASRVENRKFTKIE